MNLSKGKGQIMSYIKKNQNLMEVTQHRRRMLRALRAEDLARFHL